MKKSLKLLLAAGSVLLILLTVVFRQDIYDQWRLSQYDPPRRIEQIVDKTTMTSTAQKYFYVTHPQIDKQAAFNEHCDIQEFSIVLGCYNGRNIYLYDIKEKRLSGIVEVTAAHEMLHAAYDRLSSSEQQRVDAMTAAAFKKLSNKRIEKSIAEYDAVDPSSVPNELHSILGTEVANLPAELEEYYARYFSNRQKVVALSDKYEKEFSSRENRVNQLDGELKTLRAIIDAGQARLDGLYGALNAERTRMNGLKASGNTAAYNAAVDPFNRQVAQYNALASSTTSQIDEYNAKVKERNNLAGEVQGLVEAIDSTPEKF